MQACVNYSFWQDSENNLQKMVVYLGSLRNTTVIILDQNAMNYCHISVVLKGKSRK